MKPACVFSGILLVLHPAAPAPAREVTLPEGILLSISGTHTSPVTASNVIDRSWLVVWSETFGTQGFAVRGRIVRADGTFSPEVLEISGLGSDLGAAVAHDPIRNEWMVVWVADGGAGEPAHVLRGRKVAADGAFAGPGRILATINLPSVLGGPRVAAAAEYTHPAVPPTPYFVVVWPDSVNEIDGGILAMTLTHDPFEPSGVGAPAPPFRIDTGSEFEAPHSCTNPSITVEAPQLRGIGQSSLSNHRIAFSVFRGGVGKVYLANIDLRSVRGVARVTPDSGQGRFPGVSWNRTTGSTLVTYQTGDNAMGRLFTDTAAAPFLEPLSDASPITPAASSKMIAHPVDPTFLFSATGIFSSGAPPESGFACLSGLTLSNDPTIGRLNTHAFAIGPQYDGRILLAYQNVESDAIEVMILPEPPHPGRGFRRAEVNESSTVDISDAVYILSWLFNGTEEPACLDAADVNDSGVIDLSDPVYTLNWLFSSGSQPPSPGPNDCGQDESPDDLTECPEGEC